MNDYGHVQMNQKIQKSLKNRYFLVKKNWKINLKNFGTQLPALLENSIIAFKNAKTSKSRSCGNKADKNKQTDEVRLSKNSRRFSVCKNISPDRIRNPDLSCQP